MRIRFVWTLVSFEFWVVQLCHLPGLTAFELAREKTESKKGGCSRGDTLQFWEAKLYSDGKESNELTIDLSKSGLPGPSKVVAKWDGDGILFPDGSKWTRTSGFAGGRGS